MATTPKIRYDIEAAVSGGASVNALATSLEGLANTLEGDLKVQALASAAALRQLGEKQGAIANFRELKTEVQTASVSLRDAQAAAQQLGQSIAASGAPTRAQAGELQVLRDRVRAAKEEVQTKTAALDQSRAALNAYGVGANNLAGAERNVSAALAATRAEAGRLASGLQATGAASAAAAAVQTRLAEAAAAAAAGQGRLAAASAAAAAEQKRLADAAVAAAAEQKRLADAANAAAQTLKNALGTLGVRSAQELQAEIARVRAAMDTVRASGATTGAALNSAFAAGEAKIKALERELRAVNNQLTLGDRAAAAFSGSLGQITAGNIVADGVGYLVNKVKELGAAFLETIVGGDQLRRGLMAVYKDAGIAAQQLDFLKKSSSESGVSFSALSKDFVRFSAAMNSANIPLEQSNNLFKAVTSATASLGLGVDATTGTLNALGQMASKGVVSMEELRAQLGDRLPGAIGLTAKGFGITEAQLVTLVSSGQLATRDFIVPFTEGLKSMQGETDGLVPAFQRLKGVLAEVAQGTGDAGVTNLLTASLKLLGGTLGVVTLGLSQMVEGLFLLGAAGVAATKALFGDLSAWDTFNKRVAESGRRMEGQRQSFVNFIEPAQAATAAMTANTQSITASVTANTSLDAAQKLAAISAGLAGDATLNAASKIVQYNVAATELLVQQEAQTDAFQKSAKATKEQGDTLVRLAELTGDQVLVQETSIKAAESYSAALEKVAASQRNETAMLVAQKAELLASAKARGLEEVQIRTQTLELDKKIVASQAETDAANAAAAALRAEITARELSAKTYRDNSDSIGAYTVELNRARAALALIEEAHALGIGTEKDVEAARKRVLNATVLLNDAERDRTTAQQALTAAIRVNASLEQASLTLQMAQLKAAEAKAVADGNDFAARQARIAQKELEIKIIGLKVQAQIAEQNAVIAGIELSKAELNINDPLYKQKVAALDLSIKSAQAKILEAKAAGESVAGLERELQALKQGAGATKDQNSAVNNLTSAYKNSAAAVNAKSEAMEKLMMRYTQSSKYSEGQIALLEKENELLERRDALERKRLNIDKEGFSLNTAGARVEQRADTKRSVFENAKSQGLTEAQALAIADQFIDDAGRQKGFGGANFAAGENFSTVVQKAIDALVLQNARNGSKPTAQSASQSTAPSASAPTSEVATRPGERVLSTSQSGPANPVTGRTVTVRLVDPQGNTRNVETTETGAVALMRTLQNASLTARG